MEIYLIQIFLAILLFFLINWIGEHSYSFGYMKMSLVVKREEAPAFNVLISVLTPVVYIIIVSAILYYFSLDKYVVNIFWVNIFYIFIRLIIVTLHSQNSLLNWGRQIFNWGSIVVISYFTYEKLIKVKANILPDFTTLANELWIIIIIFVFQLANKITLSQDGTVRRKQDYRKSRYYYFKKIYGEEIKKITRNEVLEAITFAILIYEDFNRPKNIRKMENIRFRLTNKPHTLGVMQVRTSKLLTDIESITLGTTKIFEIHKTYLQNRSQEDHEFVEWYAMKHIIGEYNAGTSYCSEVTEIAETILEEFYKDTKDRLVLTSRIILNP
jgi:hypothetical protein